MLTTKWSHIICMRMEIHIILQSGSDSQLSAGLSRSGPKFNTWICGGHGGSGTVFVRVLQFCTVSFILPVLHTHEFTPNCCCLILTRESDVRWHSKNIMRQLCRCSSKYSSFHGVCVCLRAPVITLVLNSIHLFSVSHKFKKRNWCSLCALFNKTFSKYYDW